MATEGNNANKEKKNVFVRIGLWFKAAALELGKTTWPKAPDVLKKLGIVLVVVLFFFVVLFIMDILLGMGYKALISDPDSGAEWWKFWEALVRDFNLKLFLSNQGQG